MWPSSGLRGVHTAGSSVHCFRNYTDVIPARQVDGTSPRAQRVDPKRENTVRMPPRFAATERSLCDNGGNFSPNTGKDSREERAPRPPAPPRGARTRPPAVSYTHLRAHETRHDLVCR